MKKNSLTMLLHNASMAVQDIYFSLIDSKLRDEKKCDDYTHAIQILSDCFMPEISIPYEHHIYRKMFQKELETIAWYVIRLKQQAVLQIL